MTTSGITRHASAFTESWHDDHWAILQEQREGMCTWTVTASLGGRMLRSGGNYDVGLADAIDQVRATLDELGLPGNPEAITDPGMTP